MARARYARFSVLTRGPRPPRIALSVRLQRARRGRAARAVADRFGRSRFRVALQRHGHGHAPVRLRRQRDLSPASQPGLERRAADHAERRAAESDLRDHPGGRERPWRRGRQSQRERSRSLAGRRASHRGESVALRRSRAHAHPEPLTRAIRFEATDGVNLAGLLFEPRRATTRAAIWLHGTGGASVFESGRTNLLASELTEAGIAFFPFNNRGATLMRHFQGKPRGGMAYERIRECVFDIDGALRQLWRRGYRDFTLIGHSTGANKIAVYDHYKPRNRVKRYVLVAGGDDTGMIYDALGPRRFASALAKARTMRSSTDLVPPAIS